jgi:uncharacterized Zn finger protein (UPF0148 family)
MTNCTCKGDLIAIDMKTGKTMCPLCRKPKKAQSQRIKNMQKVVKELNKDEQTETFR